MIGWLLAYLAAGSFAFGWFLRDVETACELAILLLLAALWPLWLIISAADALRDRVWR